MQTTKLNQVHLNTISNGELSDPLCDSVNRGLTLVRLLGLKIKMYAMFHLVILQTEFWKQLKTQLFHWFLVTIFHWLIIKPHVNEVQGIYIVITLSVPSVCLCRFVSGPLLMLWHWFTIFSTWVHHQERMCRSHSYSRYEVDIWPQSQIDMSLCSGYSLSDLLRQYQNYIITMNLCLQKIVFAHWQTNQIFHMGY